MSNTKRLFLAIKFKAEESLIKTFGQLKSELRHERIKWTNLDHLHLTLKFFGETPVQDIDSIISAIEVISNNQGSFKLRLENLGIFGSSYQPKVIWAGISKTEELIKLEQDLMRKLEEIGFKNDRQNFIPHLTLSRIKHLSDKKLFQQIVDQHKQSFFQETKVDKIILFESVLGPKGAIHSVVHEFPFL
jgi:RNA 2',3'-cyclic 3'-phosphodiesterase